MANNKNSLTLQAEAGVLQAKLDDLSAQRDRCIDPKSFDTVSKEMAQTQRLLTLATNRAKLAREAEAQADRAAAIEKHQADLATIDKLKADLDDADENLFSHLRDFYGQVQGHLDRIHELHKLTETANAAAKDLGEPPVPIASLARLGAIWNKHIDQIANDLILAFSGQFWQAAAARRNGVDVRPDFPCVASLSTVGRITDWGPWLVKSEPPPEPDTPADVDPTPEPE